MFKNMKKYFFKILPIIIIAAILPLAIGFCFQGFFALPVQAATTMPQAMPAMPHSNSTPSCCLSSGQPSAIVNPLRLSGRENFAPTVFIAAPSARETGLTIIIYHAPNISPPERLALKTTILRL